MDSLKFNDICEKLKYDEKISGILKVIGLSIDKNKHNETYVFSNNIEQYLGQDAYLEDIVFYFVDDRCLYRAIYDTNKQYVNINKKYLKNIVSVELNHKIYNNEVELSINFIDETIKISNLREDIKGKWLSKEFSEELYRVIIDTYSKI